MKIIVDDAIKEECSDKLFEALFATEVGVDTQKMIDFIIDRFASQKNKYSLDEQKDIQNYIDCVRESKKLFDELIVAIKESLIGQYEFDAGEIGKLDYNKFWHMYAVALKKCIIMHNDVIDHDEYFKMVKVTTPRQRMAHETCIEGYAYDSNRIYKKDHPELQLFMHGINIRSKKKNIAKKNIERVKRRTRKLMQIYKIKCRFDKYNFFIGKCDQVPNDFASVIKNRQK